MEKITILKARLFDIEQAIKSLQNQYQQTLQELQNVIQEEQQKNLENSLKVNE